MNAWVKYDPGVWRARRGIGDHGIRYDRDVAVSGTVENTTDDTVRYVIRIHFLRRKRESGLDWVSERDRPVGWSDVGVRRRVLV